MLFKKTLTGLGMFEYFKFTKYKGWHNYKISAPRAVKSRIICQKH